MKSNLVVREQIFEIIENQMRMNKPPETKLTYQRLIREGWTKFEAKQLIGQCVAVELFNLLKYKLPFDVNRYVENLKQLPKEPV